MAPTYVAVVRAANGGSAGPAGGWTSYVSVNKDEAVFAALAAKARQSGRGSAFRVYVGVINEEVAVELDLKLQPLKVEWQPLQGPLNTKTALRNERAARLERGQ